jgi:hypothetical protein
MKWISVKDKIPEQFDMVLVWRETLNFPIHGCVIRCDKGEEVFWNVGGTSGGPLKMRQERNPSHWMPLPEPPKQ